MNIAIILNYFEYFTYFPDYDKRNKYFYITVKKSFKKTISNLSFIDYRGCQNSSVMPNKNREFYFHHSTKLNSVNKSINLDQISNFFESVFNDFYKDNKIDIVISGATSGFERCGMKIAKTLGIKTLYVWEGFFRPNTISVDPLGMNAEGEMDNINFEKIENHYCSKEFERYFQHYFNKDDSKRKSLSEIQEGRFNILTQIKNRFLERNDFDRIRIGIRQLLNARIRYYFQKYDTLDITKKFIIFPLQTHTDSNIVINSQQFPYQKFVYKIVDSFIESDDLKDITLVIKEHPYDVFRIFYKKKKSDRIKWINPSLPIHIFFKNPNCLGTIVVNSTAGFESLIFGKPVLCFGKAIYSQDNLTTTHDNKITIENSIKSMISSQISKTRFNKFLSYLFDHYHSIGNLDMKPTNLEVDYFIKRFL